MSSFDDIKDASIDDMRDDCTQLAIKYINSSRELYERFKVLKYTQMEKEAEAVAKHNKDEFGELFVAELPLVKWKVVKGSL